MRRAPFAIAATLTTVALTTTTAVSFTGDERTTAIEPTAEPTVSHLDMGGARTTFTNPELTSATDKAKTALSNVSFVARQGNLNAQERERLLVAAHQVRVELEQLHAKAQLHVGMRHPAAASRSGDRTTITHHTAGSSVAVHETTAPSTATDVTHPANLSGTSSDVINSRHSEHLLVLAPLEDLVEQSAEKYVTGGSTGTPAVRTDVLAARIDNAATSLQQLLAHTNSEAVVTVTAGPTPEEIAAAQKAAKERRIARAERQAERVATRKRQEAAARTARIKTKTQAAKRHGNGQIPSRLLCEQSWASGEQLRCDAAVALEKLNKAFRAAFGRNLEVTDTYRSYAEQVAVAASRGGLAAVPGTSNHGLGQAIDLSGGIQSFGTAEHNWMVAHAGKYGWKLPHWAQANGSKPEAWHWEYGTSY